MRALLISCLSCFVFFMWAIILVIIIRSYKVKAYAVKKHLKEYFTQYDSCKSVQLDSELSVWKSSTAIFVSIMTIVIILLSVVVFIITQDRLIGYSIAVIGTIILIIICFIIKEPTIQKIILNNNVIELYNSDNETKTYPLDKINIKYYISIGTRYTRLYICFDEARFVISNERKFEYYIAFAIFVDLLKRNELEKINNLSDDEIQRLQKNVRYSK